MVLCWDKNSIRLSNHVFVLLCVPTGPYWHLAHKVTADFNTVIYFLLLSKVAMQFYFHRGRAWHKLCLSFNTLTSPAGIPPSQKKVALWSPQHLHIKTKQTKQYFLRLSSHLPLNARIAEDQLPRKSSCSCAHRLKQLWRQRPNGPFKKNMITE